MIVDAMTFQRSCLCTMRMSRQFNSGQIEQQIAQMGKVCRGVNGDGFTRRGRCDATPSPPVSMAVVQSSRSIVTLHADGALRLWDSSTGGLKMVKDGLLGSGAHLLIAAGPLLVSGQQDGTVRCVCCF
jgi:hypothetical protein